MTPDRISIITYLEALAANHRKQQYPNIAAAMVLEAAASDIRAGLDEVMTDQSSDEQRSDECR